MPKKKSSQAEKKTVDPARFEEALAELEGIVGEMEGDRIPLDELLKKYERGTGLLHLCQGHIAKARERIEQIAADAKNGGVILEPFDPESGGSTETTDSATKPSQDQDKSTRDDDIQLL
jgi:exodeoxyribonuclease VII small subunit